MERRKFLIRSSQLGMSVAASSMLIGCGSSGGSTDAALLAASDTGTSDTGNNNPSNTTNNTVAPVSEVDPNIRTLDTEQAAITNNHTQIQENLNFTDTNLNDFYTTTVPHYPEESLLSDNYLTAANSSQDLWGNAKSAHQIAYDQYNHQYTKLKASLRLFEHQKNTTEEVSEQSKLIDVALIRRDSLLAADAALTKLTDLIKNTTIDNLGTTTLGVIGALLQLVYAKLKDYITNGEVEALDYAYLSYLTIEALLRLIQEKAMSDLSYDSSNDILKSLAKVSIASISVLGLASLENFNAAKEDLSDDQKATQEFLTSNSLDGDISTIWMGVVSKITFASLDELKKSLNTAILTGTLPDTSELTSTLKDKSRALSIASVALKSLFSKVIDDAIAERKTGFTEGSTADTYKVLFTSDKNPYDEALSKAVNEQREDFDEYVPVLSSELLPSFETSTSSAARAETTDIENSIYQFASELASLSYNFTMNTTTIAADFATHLSDLSYSFVMDIEEDAYQFAMKGMEYGYLFASRGEEVGIMADRILWMAVQIGVMADRIGEMADRIVYTEQLIVYTEILILEFGILIYGFGSHISNTILTGLALIFDREWYTEASNDIVLDGINSNVLVMLENMHEYSMYTLEHQNELRESTLDALDPLPYAETESN